MKARRTKIGIPSPASARPRRRAARRLRLGFIGAGWWSTTCYMPLLRARGDVDFVGVCGLDRAVLERCKRDFGFTHATTDYHELLRLDLDAVIVASPHIFHAEHAVAALRAGCHVMVDKPMATSAADARRIVAVAKQTRRHVVVPCGWQYRPVGRAAKEWMSRGAVGEVEFVLCHMASPLRNLFSGQGFDFAADAYVPANLSTWADPRVAAGGYGQGQLPHSIGLMLWLTGLRPKDVFGRMSKPGSKVDLYDAMILGYSGGAIGTISGAATLPLDTPGSFQLDVRIFGTKGMLHVDIARDHVSFHGHNGRHVTAPLRRGDGAYQCDGPPNEFVDLALGRTRENHSPAIVAMHAVEILDAAYRSVRSGRAEKI